MIDFSGSWRTVSQLEAIKKPLGCQFKIFDSYYQWIDIVARRIHWQ
jgi:hypothetical protein